MSDPKPFDLTAFRAFVASKPAGEEYDWASPRRCALAQFGCPGAAASQFEVNAIDANGVIIPFPIYRAAALQYPFEFGELLQRLEALS